VASSWLGDHQGIYPCIRVRNDTLHVNIELHLHFTMLLRLFIKQGLNDRPKPRNFRLPIVDTAEIGRHIEFVAQKGTDIIETHSTSRGLITP